MANLLPDLRPSLQGPLAVQLRNVPAAWQAVLQAQVAQPQWQRLCEFVDASCTEGLPVYPPAPFAALQLTPLDAVRVVILGQDPYHGAGQAHGLAFSVAPGVKVPPSLRNIYKELVRCGLYSNISTSGDLSAWAHQGVLLLNTVLTVREGLPASHAKQGWEAITDIIISHLGQRRQPTVFMLWGAHAQAKRALIAAQHCVLSANHPSPLSALRPPAPFIGCGHFIQANVFLQANGGVAVQW